MDTKTPKHDKIVCIDCTLQFIAHTANSQTLNIKIYGQLRNQHIIWYEIF